MHAVTKQRLRADTTAQKTESRVSDIRDAFFDRLYDMARVDRNVLFLTADMGALSLDKFKTDLSSQYINVGVAEQNLVSVAAGLALSGKRVFVYAIAPFITQRCYEQIKVDLCCMRLPVTIISVGPGIAYGSDGPTHHAVQDVANLSALPGMTILSPCDTISAAAAADEGYRSDGPVYVRLDKGNPGLLYKDSQACAAGITEIRAGRDIAIIATGIMTHRALNVAELLTGSSIQAGVFDVFRLKPFDAQLLHEISLRYGGIVVMEEHVYAGGLGGMVDQMLVDSGQSHIPRRWYGLSEEGTKGYGDREWMHQVYGLDAAALHNAVSQWWHSCSLPNSNRGKEEQPCRRDTRSHCLDVHEFAALVGIGEEGVPACCLDDLQKYDYSYRPIEGAERDTLILNALKKLDAGHMSVAGKEKQLLWEKGWSENLQKFLADKGNLEELVPAYYRPGQPCRFRHVLVQGRDPRFEYNVFRLIRSWVFSVLLKDAPAVYEFGCGPGHNLAALAKQFPNKHLFGLDWASSAVQLVNVIAREYGFDLTGRVFDMFRPDENLHFQSGAAVVTFGALEQLGNEYDVFLRFVLGRRPAFCVHVEPISDFYDKKNLIDYIATKHHQKRNMLQGFLSHLKRLEEEAKIRIMRIQHVPFGGMFTDGWSYVVWQPRQLRKTRYALQKP